MIELVDVSVHYRAIQAVRRVSLEVSRGSIVTLLGSNGAGKSSTLRAIAGLANMHSGQVLLDGKRISGRAPHRIARLGLRLVPEGGGTFSSMTVEDNLLTGIQGWYTRRRLIEGAYERFPALAERRSQTAGSLSGGERQMLALGRALASRPGFLLLDEPSLGLSPLIVSRLFETIRALKEEGIGVLLVEQNARQALEVADFAYVLEAGEMALSGPAARVREDPAVIDRYLGAATT